MIAPDKITHTLAGAAIAAALLPWGVVPSMLAVLVAAVGNAGLAAVRRSRHRKNNLTMHWTAHG